MENRLKDMLRRDKIRLWLPPYANEDFTSRQIPEDLVIKYSQETGWAIDKVRNSLIQLQSFALNRVSENKVYQDTGVATIFVNCVKPETTTLDPNDNKKIKILLSVQGIRLRETVSQTFALPAKQFKLIAAGHIVTDKRSLKEQGIAHLSEILCITITPEEMQGEQERLWKMSVDQTRHAVNKLQQQVQIADQHGNPLDLPEEEKRALSTGIALHEKGKKILKSKHPGLALLCFLEADKEFRQCRSSILQAVDNYAILCLDIVWCYLELCNVNNLPDAENRLKEAENGFRRSYGKNFERLAILKRGVEHEKVLIIRLQLLQGILAYYHKNYKRALTLLTEAEDGIRKLDVDGEKLIQIVHMGYTDTEARLGLRATSNNVEQAIQRIIEEREAAELRRKEDHHKHLDEILQQELGQTRDGNWVDVKNYRNLLSMGYVKKFAADALKRSNNDVNAALEVLSERQANGEVVSQTYQQAHTTTNASNPGRNKQTAMRKLVDMGFVSELVNDIVKRHQGDSQGAAIELLKMAEDLNHTSQMSNVSSVDQEQLKSLITEAVNETLDPADAAKSAEHEAAWATLAEDVPENLNAHLDVTLDEEEHFLVMYKNLVMSHVK